MYTFSNYLLEFILISGFVVLPYVHMHLTPRCSTMKALACVIPGFKPLQMGGSDAFTEKVSSVTKLSNFDFRCTRQRQRALCRTPLSGTPQLCVTCCQQHRPSQWAAAETGSTRNSSSCGIGSISFNTVPSHTACECDSPSCFVVWQLQS